MICCKHFVPLQFEIEKKCSMKNENNNNKLNQGNMGESKKKMCNWNFIYESSFLQKYR